MGITAAGTAPDSNSDSLSSAATECCRFLISDAKVSYLYEINKIKYKYLSIIFIFITFAIKCNQHLNL
jgi:hypothetical protein